MKKILREKLPEGRFANIAVGRSKTMASIRDRNNKTTELRLKMAFVRHGIRGWTLHPREIVGKPDFLFQSSRLAVFVDGCFWHGCSRCGHTPKINRDFWSAKINDNCARDIAVSKRLRAEHYTVLRLWEHELQSDLDGCVRIVMSLVCA